MVNKTLSDKRKNYYGDSWDYPEKDIKEFIKELKKRSTGMTSVKYFHRLIDELAGEELI